MEPIDIYENRSRIIKSGNNIGETLDLGMYLWFNNDKDPNYRYIINKDLHILEYPIIPVKQISCDCNHIHYITDANSIIYDIPEDIINDQDIISQSNSLIDFIGKTAETSDYIVINKKYDIGDKLINFGCTVCGESFTLLPSKITNFDEIEFYKNFDNKRYYMLNENFYGIHFMYALLESIAYHRIMNIPNTTGVIEMSVENIARLGDSRYEKFKRAYVDQLNSWYINN